MISAATSPDEYEAQVQEKFKVAFSQLRKTIQSHLPNGFQEQMSYGMIGYVVPHEIYPAGYHCDPKLPLPFLSIAAQKNFIAVYHMGIYADPELHDWFVDEYAKAVPTKLDMGKSCIRLKKPDQIPFKLVAQLVESMSPQEWIDLYESKVRP